MRWESSPTVTEHRQRSLHLKSLCVLLSVLSELEVSLLVLPFPYVPDLLTLFNGFIRQGLQVELVCRCLFFLLK